MKPKLAAPITFAIIIFSASATTSTIAHYADAWATAYLTGLVFALFGAVAGALMME